MASEGSNFGIQLHDMLRTLILPKWTGLGRTLLANLDRTKSLEYFPLIFFAASLLFIFYTLLDTLCLQLIFMTFTKIVEKARQYS